MASDLYTIPQPALFCPQCGGDLEWVVDIWNQECQRCECGWDNRPTFDEWLARVGPLPPDADA